MVVTHIIVDTRDAMGANAVNTMAEKLAPAIEAWTGGKVCCASSRTSPTGVLARARAVWPLDADRRGSASRDDMIAAYHFAEADPYRAATHNKGIMNGVVRRRAGDRATTRVRSKPARTPTRRRNGRYTSLTHLGGDGRRLACRHAGDADARRPGRRRDEGASDGPGQPEDPRGHRRPASWRGSSSPCGLAQNFGAMKALATVGHPAGAHGPARPQRRDRGRRRRATRSTAWPRSSSRSARSARTSPRPNWPSCGARTDPTAPGPAQE